MKYMLLIYSDESKWTDDERADCMKHSVEYCHELADKGWFVTASPLHSVTTATSVQIRAGKKFVTDGPFAETHEQLGGYFIIDVDNLDLAIEIAAGIPSAPKSTVEIRPIFELDGIPHVG